VTKSGTACATLLLKTRYEETAKYVSLPILESPTDDGAARADCKRKASKPVANVHSPILELIDIIMLLAVGLYMSNISRHIHSMLISPSFQVRRQESGNRR